MALSRLYLIVFLIFAPLESLADVSHETCRVYNEDDIDLPPDIKDLLLQAPNTAVKECAHLWDWENARYRLILPPIRGDLGACQFVTRPVFKKNGIWTREQPSGLPHVLSHRVYMMPTDGACPPHSDPRYIITNQITEGAFIAATELWEQILSGSNLDVLLSKGRPEIRSKTEFRDFEGALKTNLLDPSSFDLLSVSRVPSDPVRTTAHYELLIDGPGDYWALIVDFEHGEMRLLDIHSVLF